MDYSTDAVLMTEEEMSLYLKKLGLAEKPANDLAGLAAVQYAHLTHIPYENLDSLQKKITSLNRPELFRKIILQQRGGICFELNDPDVAAKKKRGIQYCEVASRWGKANGYKEWKYLFIPAKQVMPNSSFVQLAKQFKT